MAYSVFDHDSNEVFANFWELFAHLIRTASPDYTEEVIRWATDATRKTDLSIANGNETEIWTKE